MTLISADELGSGVARPSLRIYWGLCDRDRYLPSLVQKHPLKILIPKGWRNIKVSSSTQYHLLQTWFNRALSCSAICISSIYNGHWMLVCGYISDVLQRLSNGMIRRNLYAFKCLMILIYILHSWNGYVSRLSGFQLIFSLPFKGGLVFNRYSFNQWV